MMNELLIDEREQIEDLIYEIRGKQVMLDSDLARLYGCKNGTKEINQAVKNNLDKFPDRFCWILTDDEYYNLRSKFLTSRAKSQNHGGRRYNARVFTEQGVAMLATIIKSKIASSVSIAIMDAFVAMRHYIGNDTLRISNIETKIIEHDNNIKLLQNAFQKLDEKRKVNEVYFNGQIYDAYSKIQEILNEAKKQIIIIDAYADYTLLDIIKRLNVNVTIITKKNNLLTNQDISKYNKQYKNLKVLYDNSFHDRYFILDNDIFYHCGTSVNRIGYKTFSINLISDKEISKLLIERVNKIIQGGNLWMIE